MSPGAADGRLLVLLALHLGRRLAELVAQQKRPRVGMVGLAEIDDLGVDLSTIHLESQG